MYASRPNRALKMHSGTEVCLSRHASIKESLIYISAEAGLSLARICQSQDVQLPLRQSAGINLKKYVREHWSIATDTFKGHPPDEAVSSPLFSSSSNYVELNNGFPVWQG